MNEKHLRTGYASSLPYPEIKVTKPNLEYAKLLMNDYAGIVSEMTAINQYIYHSFMEDQDVETMLENIAIVEMFHLEVLSKLIKQLGGNPVYKDASNKDWNSSYVYYGDTLCDRLKGDLEAEYNAIDNYKRDVDNIDDPYIQAIIRRIILDEEVHVELFKFSLNKYNCYK